MPYPLYHPDSLPSIPFVLLALSEMARRFGSAPGFQLLVHLLDRQLVHPGEWLPCSAAGASDDFKFASPRTMRTAIDQAEASGQVAVRRQHGRRGNEMLIDLTDFCRSRAEANHLKAWTTVVLSASKNIRGGAFCLLVVLASLLSVSSCKALRIHQSDLRAQTGLTADSLTRALRTLKDAGIIDFHQRDRFWFHICLKLQLPPHPQAVLQDLGPMTTK